MKYKNSSRFNDNSLFDIVFFFLIAFAAIFLISVKLISPILKISSNFILKPNMKIKNLFVNKK